MTRTFKIKWEDKRDGKISEAMMDEEKAMQLFMHLSRDPNYDNISAHVHETPTSKTICKKTI